MWPASTYFWKNTEVDSHFFLKKDTLDWFFVLQRRVLCLVKRFRQRLWVHPLDLGTSNTVESDARESPKMVHFAVARWP